MTSPISPHVLLAVPMADVTLAVAGEPSAAFGLQEMTAPFYQPVSDPRGAVWTLHLELARLSAGPAPDGEPAHEAEFDIEARSITVRTREAAWLPVFARRYTRTLTRALAIGDGAVPLHGAAVVLNGAGIILVGEKMAGKTTSALSLVRTGAALVSNDDVLLVADPVAEAAAPVGGVPRWRMIGGPRSVGIRLESLAAHRPALTAAQVAEATAGYPANRAEKLFLHPGAVGRLGGTVRTEAPALLVIELVCEPGEPAGRRLDDEEAAGVLDAYLELAADRRRNDLIEALGAPPPSLAPRTTESLLRGLEFHRYSHPISGWVDDLLSFAKSAAGSVGHPDSREVAG